MLNHSLSLRLSLKENAKKLISILIAFSMLLLCIPLNSAFFMGKSSAEDLATRDITVSFVFSEDSIESVQPAIAARLCALQGSSLYPRFSITQSSTQQNGQTVTAYFTWQGVLENLDADLTVISSILSKPMQLSFQSDSASNELLSSSDIDKIISGDNGSDVCFLLNEEGQKKLSNWMQQCPNETVSCYLDRERLGMYLIDPQIEDVSALLGLTDVDPSLTKFFSLFEETLAQKAIIPPTDILIQNPFTFAVPSFTYGQKVLPKITTLPQQINADAVSYQFKPRGALNETFTSVLPEDAGQYTAKAIVPATGIYAQTEQELNFTILPKNLTATMIESIAPEQYTGSPIEPKPTLYDEQKVLTEGTDFSFSYSNHTSAGDAILSTVGMGNYMGTITKSFSINKATAHVVFPEVKPISYGQMLSESALLGGSQNGTFSWTYPTAAPILGISQHEMIFTPSDPENYDYSAVSGWDENEGIVRSDVSVTTENISIAPKSALLPASLSATSASTKSSSPGGILPKSPSSGKNTSGAVKIPATSDSKHSSQSSLPPSMTTTQLATSDNTSITSTFLLFLSTGSLIVLLLIFPQKKHIK